MVSDYMRRREWISRQCGQGLPYTRMAADGADMGSEYMEKAFSVFLKR